MQNKIKTLIKDSVIYGTGNSAAKLVGFILIPIYTKYLNIEEFGVLGLVEVTAQILIGVFGLSLYRAFIRWYWDPEARSKQKSIFFTTLLSCAVMSLSMILIVWKFSLTMARMLFENGEYQQLMILLALNSSAQIISQVILSLMRVQQKSVLYSISNVIKIIISFLLTIYFIVDLGRGVMGIYEAQILSHIVFFLILIKYVYSNIQLKLEFKILNEMLIFSYPLIFSSLFGILISVVDRYFLKFISGLGNVGIYSFGYKIANVLKILLITPFQLAVTPIIYKLINDPLNKKFYAKMMTYSGLVIVFCAITVSIFSEDLVVLLARNRNYWASSAVIPILSFSLVFDMLRIVAINGLNITKKTKAISLIIIFISLINISLNAILIPIWQYIGAAIANLLSHILFFALMYYMSQKYYHIPYEMNKLSKLLILGVIIYFLSTISIYIGYIEGFIFKILLIPSFLFLLYIFNYFDENELQYIKNFSANIYRRLNLKK